MRIELKLHVRGGDRVLVWEDGRLRGDDEVLRRLGPLLADGRVVETDLLSVIRGAEAVTAQQAEIVNLDLVEPDDSPENGRGDDSISMR